MALAPQGAADSRTLLLKVDDGVIVFPVTAKGRRAVAQGVVQKVGGDNVARFHKEESDNALAGARELLEGEGMPVNAAMRVGSSGQAIAEYAKELPCDQIVMGTRGLGRIGSLVLGSVATQVVHLADYPVTLIK